MGREQRDKGVHVALGPMTNMGRVAQGGRNWEGFGGDPYLSGEATYETVLGLQQGGVAACVKHLVAKYVCFRFRPYRKKGERRLTIHSFTVNKNISARNQLRILMIELCTKYIRTHFCVVLWRVLRV